jgi:hypothetical protein
MKYLNEEELAFAEHIKNKMEDWCKTPAVIPEFVAPNLSTRRFNIKIKNYIIYAASVAACVAFLILFLPLRKNKANEFQMIYCLEGEFDSNRPFAQQEMTIRIFDANGRIVEYN